MVTDSFSLQWFGLLTLWFGSENRALPVPAGTASQPKQQARPNYLQPPKERPIIWPPPRCSKFDGKLMTKRTYKIKEKGLAA
jgi:hypothetical protein